MYIYMLHSLLANLPFHLRNPYYLFSWGGAIPYLTPTWWRFYLLHFLGFLAAFSSILWFSLSIHSTCYLKILLHFILLSRPCCDTPRLQKCSYRQTIMGPNLHMWVIHAYCLCTLENIFTIKFFIHPVTYSSSYFVTKFRRFHFPYRCLSPKINYYRVSSFYFYSFYCRYSILAFFYYYFG